jgi:hypothetical protein
MVQRSKRQTSKSNGVRHIRNNSEQRHSWPRRHLRPEISRHPFGGKGTHPMPHPPSKIQRNQHNLHQKIQRLPNLNHRKIHRNHRRLPWESDIGTRARHFSGTSI